MILLQSFIGFYAIFIAPQIFVYYKYTNLKYSLVLSYGMILSFTATWLLLLVIYYLKIPDIFIQILAVFIFCFSLIYMYSKRGKSSSLNYIFWIIAFLAIIPLFQYINMGFVTWDAVNSWNRWGIELYNNDYDPINAAYPVLLPAVWAMLYKIQGTSDIWQIARISMFVLPFLSVALLTASYYESKNKSYLYMLLFLYPFLIEYRTTMGDMDIPVMLMGSMSLIILYSAELNKGKEEYIYYLYAALLIAGISSIIKQAGLAFVFFNIVYLLLNLRYFTNKRSILLVTLGSLLYFISYLPMYYLNGDDGIVGNIDHLKEISVQMSYSWEDIQKVIPKLWKMFFSTPYTIEFLKPWIGSFLSFHTVPYILGIGFILFIFKDLRKLNSITFLSAIFFLVGIVIWAIYFSYDARNSFWVKSFYIIFVSVNLNYFLTKYKPSFFVMFFVAIALIILAISTLDNHYAYAKQKSFQKNIGDPKLAKYIISRLLRNDAGTKDECVKINTNRQYLEFNYYSQKLGKQIMLDRYYPLASLQKNELEHDCKDGRYIILRNDLKYKSKYDWDRVQSLVKDGIIIPIKHGNDHIFFVPPNVKLEEKYLEE